LPVISKSAPSSVLYISTSMVHNNNPNPTIPNRILCTLHWQST